MGCLLAIGLLGCTPRLDEGQFTCELTDPGSCPEGWVCLVRGVERACFRDFVSTCGNGVIEPGEQCDGTAIPESACAALGYAGGIPSCLSFCVLHCAGCGNGLVDPGEECDHAAENSDLPDAACRTDCHLQGCGDGIVDTDEICDEGEDNSEAPDAWCRTDCRPRRCGDGVIDSGEECDDGRNADGNGCSATCRVESGWTCLGAPSRCLPATFVPIPAGEFLMGSPPGEPGRRDNELQLPVTLTRDFEIQTTEVTQQEFELVMGYNPSTAIDCGPTCPVEQLTWYEAAAFTNALSALAGLEPCYTCTGDATEVICGLGSYDSPYACPGYRLPTEAEWEYAARAGTTAATYNGTTDATLCPEGPDPVLDPIGTYCGRGGPTPSPVALKAPNPWGLFDVYGNASEWVHDWARRDWDPIPEGEQIDPWGLPGGYWRIQKGGCWRCYAWTLRAGARLPQSPWVRRDYYGLRPARSL